MPPVSFDLYPAIDLRNGRCVRLVQGDYEREVRYDANPVEVAHEFAEAGTRWIHMVDLDAARTGEPQPQNRAVIRPAGPITKADRLRQILAYIHEEPGISPGKLAEVFELKKPTISGYLNDLDGVITKVKVGRGFELYPADADSSAAPGDTPSPAPNNRQ